MFVVASATVMSFLTLVILSVTAGILAMVFTLVAILRRRLRLLWFALIFFVISGVCGGLAVYRAATGLNNRVKDALAPRTGLEIYAALFGEPVTDCVQVTHCRDQIIPKLDSDISLRLKTCPEEMKRMLGLAPYTISRVTSLIADRASAASGDFAPETMTDTITLGYLEVIPGRNWRWIYCSSDSTEVIVVDVLD